MHQVPTKKVDNSVAARTLHIYSSTTQKKPFMKLALPFVFGAVSLFMVFGLELYDLETDIGEATDVASKFPEVVARLQKYGDIIRAELGDSRTKVRGAGARTVGQLKQ